MSSPDDKPVAGVVITVRLSHVGQSQINYLSSFKAVTNEKGEFAIRDIPQWNFVLYIDDPKKRWTFRPCEDLFVLSHEHPDLPLTMEKGIVVTGRVLDPDGKPVEGAAISVIGDQPEGAGLADGMSDANGRYQLRLPAGSARLYFNSVPDGFTYPKPQIIKKLEILSGSDDIHDLDFTIPREEITKK